MSTATEMEIEPIKFDLKPKLCNAVRHSGQANHAHFLMLHAFIYTSQPPSACNAMQSRCTSPILPYIQPINATPHFSSHTDRTHARPSKLEITMTIHDTLQILLRRAPPPPLIKHIQHDQTALKRDQTEDHKPDTWGVFCDVHAQLAGEVFVDALVGLFELAGEFGELAGVIEGAG